MDIGEDTCCGECCELCKFADSQTFIPETNSTLYVSKKKKKTSNKPGVAVIFSD